MRISRRISPGLAAAAALCVAAGAATAAESVYTSIKKDCLLFSTDEVGASSVCKGAFGFNVILDDSDARIYFRLAHPDWTGVAKLTTTTLIQRFSWPGSDVVEWRHANGAPFAFIVRVGYQVDENNTKSSRLLVAKIDRKDPENTCFVGAATTNDEAHAMARDAARLPCAK